MCSDFFTPSQNALSDIISESRLSLKGGVSTRYRTVMAPLDNSPMSPLALVFLYAGCPPIGFEMDPHLHSKGFLTLQLQFYGHEMTVVGNMILELWLVPLTIQCTYTRKGKCPIFAFVLSWKEYERYTAGNSLGLIK